MTKTFTRVLKDQNVRVIWDEDSCRWWYVATDVVEALGLSTSARRYWNTYKTRHPELATYCKKLRVSARDAKSYLTDCVMQEGINTLLWLVGSKNAQEFATLLDHMMQPIDVQSKRKAYELFDVALVGIDCADICSLQQMHAYLFEGLYEFCGQIRTENLELKGFSFTEADNLQQTFLYIKEMPEDSFDAIMDKYVEMHVAHPFLDGNGRTTRIWLDQILKARLNVCVDWELVDKNTYFEALQRSAIDSKQLKHLLQMALSNDISNRRLYEKGIDCSYYYEDVK